MNKNWQRVDFYNQNDGTVAETWMFGKPGVTFTIRDTKDGCFRCNVECVGKDLYSWQYDMESAISWCITAATEAMADLTALILESAQ